MRANKGRWLACSWLVPALVLGLTACCCPKPEAMTPPDLTEPERAQVRVATKQLDDAQNSRNGAWTPDDDSKFSAAISTLPVEPRLHLMNDLVRRQNDEKLKPVHPRRVPGQVVCPGLCDSGVRTTTTTTQPGTTDTPIRVVPGATGKAVAK